MSLLRHVAALLMLGPAIACAAPGSPPERSPVPGDAHFGWYIHAGEAGERRFRLYIPGGLEPDQPAPLVVMLHGCTQGPDDFARGTRMNSLADEHGFLVAYPEQTTAAQPQKCWNWYDPAHQNRGAGEPALIAGITRQIMTEHRVDARRVYLAGVSAGGAMAVLTAVGYPELYAALASHSGTEFRAASGVAGALAAMQTGGPDPRQQGEAAFRAMGEQARRVPLIVFHGAADPVVRPVNAEQTVAQWRRTLDLAGAELRPADAVAPDSAGGRAVRRAVYRDVAGAELLESWLVDGLGHAWSGGSPDGSYTDPAGPDASWEIVRFFLEHPRSP